MGILRNIYNKAKAFISPIWNKAKGFYHKLKGGYEWVKQKISEAANSGIPLLSELGKFAEGSGIFGTIDSYVSKADSIIDYVDRGSSYLDHMINNDNPNVNLLKDSGSSIFKVINAHNQRITDSLKSGEGIPISTGVIGGSVYGGSKFQTPESRNPVTVTNPPVQSVVGSGAPTNLPPNLGPSAINVRV